jgi:hypothetical protein
VSGPVRRRLMARAAGSSRPPRMAAPGPS